MNHSPFPAFSGYNRITVRIPDHPAFFEKELTEQEFQQVKNDARGKRTVGVIPASLYPVRTHDGQNFLRDFFLPTTLNHAVKVEDAALKIFAILGALFFDLLTLPIRLISSLPRVVWNTRQEENPLHKYLREQGAGREILESDRVKVKLEWTSLETANEERRKKQHWKEFPVHFVEVPDYDGSDRTPFGMMDLSA